MAPAYMRTNKFCLRWKKIFISEVFFNFNMAFPGGLSHWMRGNNNTLLEWAWCCSQILHSHFLLSHLLIPQASTQLGVTLFWLGVVLAQLVPPAVNSSVLVISAAALGLSKANSVKKEERTVCAWCLNSNFVFRNSSD